jgi:UPF0716 protein FxsA
LARFFLLFPALFAFLELAVLIEIGDAIGTLGALALVVAGIVAGAMLVKRGGLGALRGAQDSLRRGEAPGGALFDGACIVAAGLLFAFPGVVSDLLALPLVLPWTRAALLRWLASRVVVRRGGGGTRIIEGEWHEVPDESPRLPR